MLYDKRFDDLVQRDLTSPHSFSALRDKHGLFAIELGRVKSIPSALRLLCLESDGLIEKIRFYHYFEECGVPKIVSVDSHGHDPNVTANLRQGIVQQDAAHSQDVGSFLCFDDCLPTVFQVDTGCDKLSKLSLLDRFQFIKLPNPCFEILVAEYRPQLWLDIPLRCGHNIVGKLSADLRVPLDQIMSHSLAEFDSLCQATGPLLDSFYHASLVKCPRQIISAIWASKCPDELFQQCIRQFPRIFGCEHCSILTTERTVSYKSRLVLRKTSFQSSRFMENEGFYEVPGNGLTAWVASTGKPLRLVNLAGKTLDFQLRNHDIELGRLDWKNRIPDSDSHSSLLACPIGDTISGVCGVIRLTDKYVNQGFTFQDLMVLIEISAAVKAKLHQLQAVTA